MKIAVICGGLSPEREVSLSSGKMVSKALRERGHEVALCDLCEDISPNYPFTVQERDFSPRVRSELSEMEIGNGILELCRRADTVFPALHGGVGEDGHFQALLELYGISHTGPSFLGCALSMDKELSKILMREAGVTVPRGISLSKGEEPDFKRVKFPCVIKPNVGGSSVGVAFAERESELVSALESAFSITDKVMIEEKLVGRELTVGILNGRALPAVEIKPKRGFYDYKNKYIAGLTDELCPASLSEAEALRLGTAALRAAEVLRLDSYCRADFILSGGIFYCLEVNALPGMTETSLLPLAASAVGMTFAELCEKIIGVRREIFY